MRFMDILLPARCRGLFLYGAEDSRLNRGMQKILPAFLSTALEIRRQRPGAAVFLTDSSPRSAPLSQKTTL